MASEWQTVSTSRKKTKTPVSNPTNVFESAFAVKAVGKPDSSIIKYTDEQIYSFKKIHKEQMVSYELSVKFDKINEMFKTSTQYLESKKKINYNQYNHNRWELKKEEDNGVINIVCIGLNKITEQNSDEIIKEIETQEIVMYDDLEKLTEKIIHKCISEPQFIKLYVKVIKHIMLKCSWIVDDQNMVPVTFRRVLLNQLEMRFSNLINDVKNMKYEESESELVVIHNKQKKGLISLICELYSSKIIGNQLVRYIFRNLETAFDSTGIEQYLEYWLSLLSTVMISWLLTEKQYLDEQIQYISSKTIKTLKVKFTLDDIFDELKKKNYLPSEISNVEVESEKETYEEPINGGGDDDDDEESSYDPLILSHGEYETTESWSASLDADINWDKFLLDLLQFTISEKSELELVKKILGHFILKSLYKTDQVQDKINWIRSENDFSEYRYYLKDLEELELFVKNLM
jgi:hypothetical protein